MHAIFKAEAILVIAECLKLFILHSSTQMLSWLIACMFHSHSVFYFDWLVDTYTSKTRLRRCNGDQAVEVECQKSKKVQL